MTNYQRWRENEIKRVGIKTQSQAEQLLDKQAHESFIDVVDEKTGENVSYRKSVAERFLARKTYSKRKLVFSVPAIPGVNC